MRLTVVGGCGAWPSGGDACSGYLVAHDGFTLLLDPGYAVASRLFRTVDPDAIDAVIVSHRHPDHCVDLNPILRARVLRDEPREAAPPLPVYALPGALDVVLALDRPAMLDGAYDLRDVAPGRSFAIGPFAVDVRLLPHSVPNAGFRLQAGGAALAYTGDAGPDPALPELARDADVLLAEASYAERVPADMAGQLSSAADAARQASEAGVAELVLTHLLPGTDRRRARDIARRAFDGRVRVARAGLTLDVG